MKKATALIFSFLSVWALMLSFGLSARNPLTIAAFAGIAFLIYKTFDLSEPKGIVFIHLTAVLLAFFTFIVKIEVALSLYENKVKVFTEDYKLTFESYPSLIYLSLNLEINNLI